MTAENNKSFSELFSATILRPTTTDGSAKSTNWLTKLAGKNIDATIDSEAGTVTYNSHPAMPVPLHVLAVKSLEYAIQNDKLNETIEELHAGFVNRLQFETDKKIKALGTDKQKTVAVIPTIVFDSETYKTNCLAEQEQQQQSAIAGYDLLEKSGLVSETRLADLIKSINKFAPTLSVDQQSRYDELFAQEKVEREKIEAEKALLAAERAAFDAKMKPLIDFGFFAIEEIESYKDANDKKVKLSGYRASVDLTVTDTSGRAIALQIAGFSPVYSRKVNETLAVIYFHESALI